MLAHLSNYRPSRLPVERESWRQAWWLVRRLLDEGSRLHDILELLVAIQHATGDPRRNRMIQRAAYSMMPGTSTALDFPDRKDGLVGVWGDYFWCMVLRRIPRHLVARWRWGRMSAAERVFHKMNGKYTDFQVVVRKSRRYAKLFAFLDRNAEIIT